MSKYILISEYGELLTDIVPADPSEWNLFSSKEEAIKWMRENHESGTAYLIPVTHVLGDELEVDVDEDDFIDPLWEE